MKINKRFPTDYFVNEVYGIIIFLFLALLTACSEYSPEAHVQEMKTSEDTQSVLQGNEEAAEMLSSSAARTDRDSTRKMVRTAELRFSVNDVRGATFDIENAVSQFGGFVTYTYLSSRNLGTNRYQITRDSIMEVLKYSVQNDMIIRVPNDQLDATLRSFATQMDYLDYRIIKAEDVTLSFLSNRLKKKRMKHQEKRLKENIRTKKGELDKALWVEEAVADRMLKADNAQLANAWLNDQIAYSTIKLHLYQKASTKAYQTANEKVYHLYEPSLSDRLKAGLAQGWLILEFVFILLSKSWSILLLVLLAWFGYQRFIRK